MFANLGNLLGDEQFWGGVAEGFTTEINRQQVSKEKDVRELRNFGIEMGMKVKDENDKTLADTEASIIELASLIKGKRNVRDKSVREGALALLEQYGSVSAAASVAKDLNVEYKTYGRDPIKTLGFVETDDTRTAPTISQISRKFSKLKAMPNLSSSEIDNITEMTALDRIFGGKGTTELAMEGVEKFIGPLNDQTEEAIPISLSMNFDEEMVLGANLDSELFRMYALSNALSNIPEDQQDESYKSRVEAVKQNIDMLDMARSKTKEKTSLSIGERNSIVRIFGGELQRAAGLAGDYDAESNLWIPKYKQADIFRISQEAGNEYADALNWAFENGVGGKADDGSDVDAYTFIRSAAVNGFRVTVVVGTDTSPAYLTRGEKVYDTSSQAFKQALPGAVQPLPNANTGASANTNASSTANAAVNPPPGTGATTYSPSQRVAALVPKLTNPSTTPVDRKASARAIMAAIKLGIPSATQADHENAFEQTTGMSFADATK